MLTVGWITLALAYIVGLFWLGRWGEKGSRLAQKLTSHPAVYSLALAIYCTAWTFFGSVGEASRNNWQYLPILLGPILVYVLGYRFIHKLTLVSKKQHITTIADFISSRYGKRQTVALLVTLIALLATIPYIALQLKAIGSAFQLMSNTNNSEWIVLCATILIALFSIYFGTQRTDVTEYRRGLMLAIAFESTIKLLALVSVAVVALIWWNQHGSGSLFSSFTTDDALSTFKSFPFIAQTLMAAAAVICLPRQFHVAVVDNLDLSHIKTARWLFPLYLAITAMVIPIIAAAGQSLLADNGLTADTHVLNIAKHSGTLVVQMLVFVGGLSAATAMIIVATLTLSTMLTNDVILPKLLTLERTTFNEQPNYTRIILILRRCVIAAILLLAYLYHQQLTNSRTLASIGLIAFSLVIQLLPAIVGGLYWKKGHAHGVYAGLIAGLCSWLLWLMLPMAGEQATIDLQSNVISQGALISLGCNGICYVLFSWLAPTRLVDRIQAQAFVEPREHLLSQNKKHSGMASTGDLITLLSTFLGDNRCASLVKDFQQKGLLTLHHNEPPTEDFIAFCERALGGVLGSSSANALIDSVLRGKKLNFEEVVNFFDETTQALQFNTSALFTSIESLDQGISVVDKELKLVAWNQRYVDLFDYPAEMITVGTPVADLVRYNAKRGECGIGDIDMLVNKRLEHMRSGHPHKFVRQRNDGKVIEMVGNPLPGGGFVTSFTDITTHIELQKALKESNIDLEKRIKIRAEEVQAINAELRNEIARRAELEVELVNARKAAEDANASKTRFLALASHDILQPLNAARLYLSALQELELQHSADDILTKLDDSVTSSEALIATILDIARLDQGDMQPEQVSLSLKSLLTPLINEYAMQASHKGLKLNVHLQDLWVLSDPTYLQRIVQNLLSNAVKYTQNGRVIIAARALDDQVRIQVLDSGVGIAQSEQSRIFRDFYRVDSNKEHGVGLGLAVVTRLASKLGAPLKFTSLITKGSCFELVLPLCPKPENQLSESAPQHFGLGGMTALVVDDKTENLDAMQTLLSKWNIRCELAQDPSKACQLMHKSKPDIMLVDYHLNDAQNGMQLIETLRQQPNGNIPAALVTANQDKAIIDACTRADIAYISKPIKPAKLRAVLMSMQSQCASPRTGE